MTNDNQNKALVGRYTKIKLITLLKELHEDFSTYFNYSEKIKAGFPDMNPDQFTMDAKITFYDNEVWFIRTSNTFRSDRIKGNEYEAYNFREIFKEKHDNMKFIFTFPVHINGKEMLNFSKFSTEIELGTIKTYYDMAITINHLRELIIEKCLYEITSGKKANIIGENAEKYIASTFENPKNRDYWNYNKIEDHTSSYTTFQGIVMNNLPEETYIKETQVFTDEQLKQIRGGGKPKTDVAINIIDQYNKNYSFNLSVKRPSWDSKSNSVTVHQGTIEQLYSDLAPHIVNDFEWSNEKLLILKDALYFLQKFGGVNKLKEEKEEYYNFLDTHLQEINPLLIKYFLFGINNSRLDEIQKANFLVTLSNKTGLVSSHDIETTVEEMMRIKKQFNTPFSWTYPSKKRGKQIQIKAPILS